MSNNEIHSALASEMCVFSSITTLIYLQGPIRHHLTTREPHNQFMIKHTSRKARIWRQQMLHHQPGTNLPSKQVFVTAKAMVKRRALRVDTVLCWLWLHTKRPSSYFPHSFSSTPEATSERRGQKRDHTQTKRAYTDDDDD